MTTSDTTDDSYTIVSHGVCDTVGYFEEGQTFSALAPKDTICPGKESTESDSGKELESMIQITMFVGLLFLLFVMFRSCSRVRVDWYRLIFLYIIGTLGVPISIFLGPTYGGFNRVAGFGVMVHNMAELFILGRIWRGMRTEQNTGSFGVKFVVMYVWIILSLLTFLPLSPLFLIAMLQGGMMDWTLVMTFLLTGVAMQQHDGKYFWYGFGAALTHILSIQPLFFGFSLAYTTLDGITVLFLIPTFIIYMWFASADSNTAANIISPVPTGSYVMDAQRNKELHKIVVEMKEITIGKNGGDNDQLKSRSATGSTGDKGGNDEKKEHDNGDSIDNEDTKNRSILNNVLANGLLATEKGKQAFVWVLVIAGAITITNAMLVWFSPCYIDTKFLCD